MQHLELPTKHSKRVPEITVDNKLDEKLADDDIDTIKITHFKKGSRKLKQSCRPKKKNSDLNGKPKISLRQNLR